MICKIIKNQPAWRSIPVLFMTALDTPEEKLRAFGAGAVDYILKPVHPAEVLARVNTHLQIRALQRSLEEELAMRIEAENELRQSLDRAVVLIDATGSRLDARGVSLYAQLLRRPRHVAGVLAMMSNWNLQQLQTDLPRLGCPLCLVAADSDLTVPPRQAQQSASRVPGATVQWLQGLGHLAHEEAPERVADVLLACLAGGARPRAAP